jgi:hypothetical protein
MDKNLLVSSGQALVRALDAADLAPRFAMWVHNTDTDTWKLWLVPPATVTDKRDFYRRISSVVSNHRAELGGIDTSDTEMVVDSHPAIKGLRGFIRAPGLGSIHFAGNSFNGFNMPDGIILRSDL